MNYKNIVKGIFIARPNRFIAHVLIGDKIELCHVKNTGRCKELLTDKAIVYLEHSNNIKRKTAYSLISVQKGNRLINIDSQAPNKAFFEALSLSVITLPDLQDISTIKSEKVYGNSRFDFYIESNQQNAFVEVKGVTLEENGVVKFPDAPTKRGLKHIHELVNAKENGYLSYLVFVVQMNNVKYFSPNNATQEEFGLAMQYAQEKGVKILAYECDVDTTSMSLNGCQVEVKL